MEREEEWAERLFGVGLGLDLLAARPEGKVASQRVGVQMVES